MSIFSYSAQDAALMASLAEQAGSDLDILNPPDGWSVALTFSDPFMGGQGYIVIGTLPSNQATVAVAAMGSTWDGFTQGFDASGFALAPVAGSLPAAQAGPLARHTLDLHRQLQSLSLPLPTQQPEHASRLLALPARLKHTSDALAATLDQWLPASGLEGEAASQARLAGNSLLEQIKQVGGGADPAGLQHAVARMRATVAMAVAPIDGMIQAGYLNQWSWIQPDFAAALKRVSQMGVFAQQFPVVFAGITVGGPLAQIAAAYSAPGTSWGGQDQSPVTDIACYALSSPAFGDAAFAASFNARLPTAYTVNASNIDFFPSAPVSYGTKPLVQTGQLQTLQASMPAYDSPWAERTAHFYGQALGFGQYARLACCRGCEGTDGLRDFAGALMQAVPQSYSAQTAAPLSILCSLTYLRYQHPGQTPVPPAPWVWVADIAADSVTWGSVFANPTSHDVALVFRGTVSEQELVERIADCRAYLPTWLQGAPSDAGVGNGIGTLYAALRDKLAAAIQAGLARAGSGGRLLLAGHDAGGNLAGLAMLDLIINPRAGLPAPAQAYSIGAPPFALISFTKYYATKVPADTVFQVARVSDVVPRFALNQTVYTVGAMVPLTGGDTDPYNGNSYHAISTYIALLNPGLAAPRVARTTLADLARVGTLPPAGHALFSRTLEQRNITPAQVAPGVLDSAASPDGVLRLAWSPRGGMTSSLPIVGLDSRRMDARFAAEEVWVRGGHKLQLEAPEGHTLQVALGRLRLDPGAVVEVAAQLVLHIGDLQGGQADAPPITFEVIGAPGSDGPAGGNGYPGAPGAPGIPGGNGGNGGNGGSGSVGMPAFDAKIMVGRLDGVIHVVARGGTGGRGGAGGAGGNGGNSAGGSPGGNGGSGGGGGPGGNGGVGSSVLITYTELGPGGRVEADTAPASGGAGGSGGRGGVPGAGTPDGSPGPNGPSGPYGAFGRASIVIVRQQA